MVRTDRMAIKEKIRQHEMGSCSAQLEVIPAQLFGKGPSGTSPDLWLRALPIGLRTSSSQERWNSKDGSQTTTNAVTKDSRRPRCRASSTTCTRKMVLDSYTNFVDWEQTKTEQGTWPTKVKVNMWFSSETNLPTMLGLLESRTSPTSCREQAVSSRPEMARAHALFHEGLKAENHVVMKLRKNLIVKCLLRGRYAEEKELRH